MAAETNLNGVGSIYNFGVGVGAKLGVLEGTLRRHPTTTFSQYNMTQWVIGRLDYSET